jgi:hypothetical protein
MLQKRNLIIKHIEGKGNVIADALSRVGYGCPEFMQRFLVKSLYSDFCLFISSKFDVLFVHGDKLTSSVKITYQK